MNQLSKLMENLEKKDKQEKSLENKTDIKEIENILIDDSIVQQLIVLCNDSYNFNSEGLLYGYVDENNSLVVTNSIPFNFLDETEENHIYLNTYLKNNRLDYLKIGHFICLDHSDFLNKKNIKYFVDFQKKFPNAIILFLDYNLYKLNKFAFKIFRINKILMEKVEKIEIEEEDADILKKVNLSDNILKNFEFKVIQDSLTLFSSLELYDNYNSQKENKEVFSQNNDRHLVFKNLNEMNKISEKFIEEQKKFINYFKNKKIIKKEEFEILNKKKESSISNFDKLEISILVKNLKNLTDHLKTITNSSLINNSVALKSIN